MNRTGILNRVEPCALLSFLLPLCIYLLTLAPSVTFFDSGEFLTAVSSLGVAHSPGYPLFINYAKPFTLIPLGNIAFRVNFATAISAALACYGVYLLTLHIVRDEELPWGGESALLVKRLVALAGSLAFACSARLWLQSNHDKPYPLLSFICAVIFYLMLLWRESYQAGRERPGYVYLGAFLCGLGTGAHQIVVLMIPVYAFLLLSTEPRLLLRVKEILIAVAFGIFGFAIHLHLIVRALQKPLLNWGDSRNLTQFLWNLLRKGYPSEKPVRDLHLLWAQINAFNVPGEFTAAGLLLLLIGLLGFAGRKRELVFAYVIGLISFLAVIVGYFNTPFELIFLTEEFFTPLYLLSAVFIALGLFTVLREIPPALAALAGEQAGPALLAPLRRLLGNPARRLLPLLELRQARLALLSLLFVLPAVICGLNYVENDQHENYIAYDYASNTLRGLPQGAVMYTWGDSGAFPLWYVQGVERMREDLDLPHTPHLIFNWYLDGFPRMFTASQLRSLPLEQMSPDQALLLSIQEQLPRRPVFIDFSTRFSVDLNNFVLHQRGISYQLLLPGVSFTPSDADVWDLYTLRNISENSGMFFRDLDTGKAILIYGSAKLEGGESYLRAGMNDAGRQEIELSKRISPELAPQANQILKSYGLR